jgi:hypothetical protein
MVTMLWWIFLPPNTHSCKQTNKSYVANCTKARTIRVRSSSVLLFPSLSQQSHCFFVLVSLSRSKHKYIRLQIIQDRAIYRTAEAKVNDENVWFVVNCRQRSRAISRVTAKKWRQKRNRNHLTYYGHYSTTFCEKRISEVSSQKEMFVVS